MPKVAEPVNTAIATSTKQPSTFTQAITMDFPVDTNIIETEHRDRITKE